MHEMTLLLEQLACAKVVVFDESLPPMNSQEHDLHAYDGPETSARRRMNIAAPDVLNVRSNADDVFELLHHSTQAEYKA